MGLSQAEGSSGALLLSPPDMRRGQVYTFANLHNGWPGLLTLFIQVWAGFTSYP